MCKPTQGVFDDSRVVPQPVIAYLAAEQAKDARSLAGCFAEDGTVHDEGRDYHGRVAIQRWKEEADVEVLPVAFGEDPQLPSRVLNVPLSTPLDSATDEHHCPEDP